MVVLVERISQTNSLVDHDRVSVKISLKLLFAFQGRIQNPVKYLRQYFLRICLTVENVELFLQKVSSQMFQWILNMPLNLLQLFNIAKVNKNMKVLDDSFPQNTFEQLPEVVDQTYSVKKVFLEILQNSQENTCARVSFLIKLQA